MATISFEHAEEARAALREIVAESGPEILSDPQAMSNLLKDLLPDDPRTARLFVAAAEDRIADVLRDHVTQGVDGATAVRLAASALESTTVFSPEVCDWVVAEIAAAMGLLPESPDLSAWPSDPVARASQQVLEQHPSIPEAAPRPAAVTARRQTVGSPILVPPQVRAAASPDSATTAEAPTQYPRPPAEAGHPGRGRSKLLIPALVAVAVLAAVGIALATWLHGGRAAGVLRPSGLHASNRTFSSISLAWSRATGGDRPNKYEVFEDGGLLASVAGTTTSYRVGGLGPDQHHSFRLVALHGREHSPTSKTLSVTTATVPPLSSAVLTGGYDVSYSHTVDIGLPPQRKLSPDRWTLTPRCATGPCSVSLSGQFQKFAFASTVLHRHGAVYTGRTTLNDYFTCNNKPRPAYLAITVRVSTANVFGSRWQATGWTGTITAFAPANACTASSIYADIAGS